MTLWLMPKSRIDPTCLMKSTVNTKQQCMNIAAQLLVVTDKIMNYRCTTALFLLR